MAYFYTHVYFSITDKFDETVYSTGITAKPFNLLAERMISETQKEWRSSVAEVNNTEHKFLAINLSVWLICVLTFWGFLREHTRKRVEVQNICSLVEMP